MVTRLLHVCYTRQALSFGLFASLLLALLGVIVDWMGLPPPLTPLQQLWLMLLPVRQRATHIRVAAMVHSWYHHGIVV